MDRRRFLPRPEGLEHRELMTAAPGTAAAAQVAPQPRITINPNDPNVVTLRQVRIERLPAYLFQVNRDRTVPAYLVESLQENFGLIADQLQPPPSFALAAFNKELRGALSQSTLTDATARALNEVFGRVLEQAQASPLAIAALKADMSRLAQIDSQQRNPSALVAGDYALVMQLCMGIGIRIQNPTRARST
jgi:hypothetical protein